MSNTVTHSIFHQTLLCPTVAEYQSKVTSAVIPANTLYLDVRVKQAPTQAWKFLLSKKFGGRKRRLAMERHQHAAINPHAVSTTAPASEVSSKF